MKATAHRVRPTSFVGTVEIRKHRLSVDEPAERGAETRKLEGQVLFEDRVEVLAPAAA